MKKLLFNQRTLELNPNESVLDCLLRHGEALPYACKAGMCQACLIRAVDCAATEDSTKWIKPNLQAKGYTLACKWFPESDVTAARPTLADFALTASIRQLTPLNDNVLQVLLSVEDPRRVLGFRPGQYLTATNPKGCARAYSIANDYQVDGYFELHVARTAQGEWSQWLFHEAKLGDCLYLNGPHGTCYYDPIDDADAPLLLAGTGTGLAPLLGIARDALRQGHQAPITLYHGARTASHLYLVDTLHALAQQHSQFQYTLCIKEQDRSLEQVILAEKAAVPGQSLRIYLCGAPDFVYTMRKRFYLQGVRPEHIHCDPFTERTITSAF
jgi:CDP-4-dehydro-6-deoxyglucose reductase, E3